jgi:hypothetical protein
MCNDEPREDSYHHVVKRRFLLTRSNPTEIIGSFLQAWYEIARAISFNAGTHRQLVAKQSSVAFCGFGHKVKLVYYWNQ